LNYIKKENPDFDEDKYLSISELNYFRERYISDLMVNEVGELSELEKTVLSSLTSATTLTDKIDIDEKSFLTTGQKVADKVATFGGSWTFIISFLLFIFLWISLNVIWLANKGYDPYPFILLNLILSCIAALQAPVIMMSQNRQEDKDRDRSRKDYMINLKSELEIRILHEKLDHLILHQQQDILEMQKTQIDMLKDVSERFKGKE
jgi:uncharacterized membrane protein